MGILRRGARALLLVVLALGVCGMHTLGHVNARHDMANARHGLAVAHELPVAPVAPVAALAGLAPGHEMPGLDPAGVCLAVLTSLLVVVLLALWAGVRRRAVGGAGPGPAFRPVARPPPRPTSLRLARLSILRI
ncbi:hypothetical protein ACFYUV_28885 [Nonomuraea sp. NPDC003560]|uniref:hypothetical protein n=1 Tax=Nonomuraea sp. NPDC003560 TaxID=3364341 RepID=UPI0036AC3DF2